MKLLDVIARYDEPHRHYHNGDHLRKVLGYIDALLLDAEDQRILRYAAIFHDAVYDPASKRNELDSANLWWDWVIEQGPGMVRYQQKVWDLIMDTKHTLPPRGRLGRIICDADLHELVTGSPELLHYNELLIRKEFLPLTDWPTYKEARIEFLSKWVERNPNVQTLIDTRRLSTHQ